jgi:glycosyltransferase involved in cell wall biosynthesis
MEQTALLEMKGLMARGHPCRLVSLNPIGELGPLLDESRIPAMGLPYRGRAGWRSLGVMYRGFRSAPADAVMMTGHNLAAMLALGNFCRERRLLCLHYHHAGVMPAWAWRAIYRVTLRQFQAVTYPSDFVRREAEALYPPVRAISHTVRYPYELPEQPGESRRLEARELLGLPREARIVGNAGWLVARKRFDVFLRVAGAVSAAAQDVVFVVAGDGPLRSELMDLATSLGIADRVRWLGWQQDLNAFYAALNVLHFNSDWDAAPRTPVEALAHGIPLVASLVHGGLAEIVDREEYGYVSAAHDEDWLAEKVLFLLENPEAGRRMGLAARARLKELCSPERHVETICRLLRLEDHPV